ncbi:hypothetical protein DFH09DRAFT_1372079 [Mycena vulgaris]|nr:hypothetical protein DFH09DRAFT_1372079 [Mycena vulgaris]
MAPSTTSTTPTTTPRPAAAKRLSTPMRLPSLARAPKHTAVLDAEAELVSLWPRPRARRASSSSSTSSTSSATSSGSASSSHAPSSPPTKKSKSRKVRAVDMIISGVSSLLIMPMPFLKGGSPQPPPPPSVKGDADPQAPRTRRRRFSLPATRPTQVPMREEPASPLDSMRTSSCIRPPSCTIRDLPPPLAARTVRFVLPPPKFAPPIDWPGDGDEEPAWSVVRDVVHDSEEGGSGRNGDESTDAHTKLWDEREECDELIRI